MATKNLVPRANNEGELGISTRKWKGINAVSGSFEEIQVKSLKDSTGGNLIEAGTNVSIDYEDNKIKINSTGGSGGNTNKIEQGNSSVEVVDNVAPGSVTGIKFEVNGQDRWSIDENGHFLPGTSDRYNIGNSSFRVNQLHLESDALIFKSNNILESQIKINNQNKLQFGVIDPNGLIIFDNVVTAKADVRVATVENFAGTYDSGTTNLTASTAIALEIDGVALSMDDRVLLKDQTTATENGIYKVLVSGSSNSQPILQRTQDFQEGSDFSNVKVSVLEGTKNSQKIFFTVPTTSGESLTQTNNLKWLDISGGGGGLEKVEDDPAPKLGGNLDVNNKTITNSSGNLMILGITNPSSVQSGGIGLIDASSNSAYGVHNQLIFLPPSDTTSTTRSRISFQDLSASYTLDIEFDPHLWHSANSLSASHSFTFPELVQAEKTNTFSTFATQEWVTHQGYATNAIQTNDDATLNSLTLSTEPSNDSHAATKLYVDSKAMGVSKILDTCKRTTVAEISNADASYDPATKRFTSIAQEDINTSSDFDGRNISAAETDLAVGDRILVKDQTTATQNGIYKVIVVGVSNSANWVLERTSDFDTAYEANGTFVFVTEGEKFGSNGFVCTSPTTADTVGTHDINFSISSAASRTTVTDPLTKSNSNQISLNLDGKTLGLIDINGNGTADKLGIKLNGSALGNLNTLHNDDLFYVERQNNTGGIALKSRRLDIHNSTKLKNFITNSADNQVKATYTLGASPSFNDTFLIQLTKKAITEQTEYDPSADGEVQNSDYLLIADTSNTTDANLRKIKVEDLKIKNFDIHSLPAQTTANELSSEDEIAVYDTGTSKNIKVTITELSTLLSSTGSGSLTYKQVEGQTVDTALPANANVHYHIIQSDQDIKYTLALDPTSTAGMTFTKGDIIKITMSPKFSYLLDPDHVSFTQSGSDNIVEVTFTTNAIVSYNQNDLVKPLELIYDGSGWTTSMPDSHKSFKQSNLGIVGIGNELKSNTKFNDYSNYFVSDNGTDLVINIFSAANALSSGFNVGDKKTLYFTHSANNSVTINSQESDIFVQGTSFGSSSSTKEIKFTNDGINKVCLTLVKIDLDATDPSFSNKPRWIIEYVLDSAPSGLPAGTANHVLKSNGTTWSGGKIASENMGADSVTGGTDANSIIASKTIVGGDSGNIADDTIDNKRLVKRANKKVLGVLTTNSAASQEVGDIDVVDDLNSTTETFNNTNLATAKSIQDYISTELNNFSPPASSVEINIGAPESFWTSKVIEPGVENIIPQTAVQYSDVNHIGDGNVGINYWVYLPLIYEDWNSQSDNPLGGSTTFHEDRLNYHGGPNAFDVNTKIILPKVGHLYSQIKNSNKRVFVNFMTAIRKNDDNDPSPPDINIHMRPAYNFPWEISKDDVSAIDFWRYYGNDGSKINSTAEMRSSTAGNQLLVKDTYAGSYNPTLPNTSACFVDINNNQTSAARNNPYFFPEANNMGNDIPLHEDASGIYQRNLNKTISYSTFPKEIFYPNDNPPANGIIQDIHLKTVKKQIAYQTGNVFNLYDHITGLSDITINSGGNNRRLRATELQRSFVDEQGNQQTESNIFWLSTVAQLSLNEEPNYHPSYIRKRQTGHPLNDWKLYSRASNVMYKYQTFRAELIATDQQVDVNGVVYQYPKVEWRFSSLQVRSNVPRHRHLFPGNIPRSSGDNHLPKVSKLPT